MQVETADSRGQTAELDLRPLLEPRSIAVVGANDRPGSYADGVLRNLKRAGFAGSVWGVNPKRSDAHGFECVPSVADLPEAVDALVVAIPAAGVPAVVAQAGERGCGGAVILSAGFGEIEAGRELEAALREAALEHGLPVCGPNGNGIVAARARAAMWGDSVAPLEPGSVAMVTQSGNVGVNALGSARGIRWHTVVSTGNQTVCDASDWLDALAGLPEVRSVALFLEADGDGARLAEALALCAERDVGVAVLKVGASQAGAVAAAAHTGSLAGDQRIFRALVEEAGAAWAEDPHELLELARALAEPQARPASAASAGCRKAAQGTPPSDTRRKTARGPGGPHLLGGRLRRRGRPGRPARHRAAPAGAGHAWAPGGTPAPGGHHREPARLHGDDLGRRRPSRAHSRRSATTPRSTSSSSATTTPATSRPSPRRPGPPSARVSSRARSRRAPGPWSAPPSRT